MTIFLLFLRPFICSQMVPPLRREERLDFLRLLWVEQYLPLAFASLSPAVLSKSEDRKREARERQQQILAHRKSCGPEQSSQHNHSSFRASSGQMIIFMFVQKPLLYFEMGSPLRREEECDNYWTDLVWSGKLLLAFPSTVILGFGPHWVPWPYFSASQLWPHYYWSGLVICCWTSSAQSLLVLGPAGPVTIYFSLVVFHIQNSLDIKYQLCYISNTHTNTIKALCFLWFGSVLPQSCWFYIFRTYQVIWSYSLHNHRIFISGLFIWVVLYVSQNKVRTFLGTLKFYHVYWSQQASAHPAEVCVRLFLSSSPSCTL
jgi:hypothetical protein